MVTGGFVKEGNQKPKYEIGQDILDNANLCEFDFSCLNGNGHCFCPTDRWISKKYLFVSPSQNINCPYRIGFGFASHVCGCPVRNELFRKYGV